MEILENISLKNYNTFAVDAKADYFISINNVNDIFRLLDSNIYKNNKNFVLGGGSNILFVEDYHGLIINIDIKSIHIKESANDYIILDVGAGEDWVNFVQTCVKSNYYGIENLAMIPGKVGAAPVQNIGAYGTEQKDFFVSLSGVDLLLGKLIHLDLHGCRFGYRTSIFKEILKDRFIITSVQYKLSKRMSFNLTYKELENEVNKFPGVEIDQKYIFDTVCRLRKSKLPDVGLIGSAGSFFKNPLVSVDKYIELKKKFKEIPAYSNSEKFKLSAGWLVEQCGWKGKRRGDAGVYEKHALILVNHGNASGSDILNLANEIKESVQDKFGINLEPEAIIIEN